MTKLLERYYTEKFYIIPIRPNEKRPVYRKWNQYPISYMEAEQHLKTGGNIAVVAKNHIILDYDRQPVDTDIYGAQGRPLEKTEAQALWLSYFRGFNTWIQFTPNKHFHIFLKGPLTGLPWYMEEHRLGKPDTVRTGDMYALLAPSKVDGKSYWWLDSMKGEILKL